MDRELGASKCPLPFRKATHLSDPTGSSLVLFGSQRLWQLWTEIRFGRQKAESHQPEPEIETRDILPTPGMDELITEPCGWDEELGFVHQHFCSHSCHAGPTGFGHILVCCGREVATDDIKCSSRCARPHNSEQGLVDAPNCPHCGPWSCEALLVSLLEGVEWWFHFFALLPQSTEVRHRLSQLREYQAEILKDMNPEWKEKLTSYGSIYKFREYLQETVEKQKDAVLERLPISQRTPALPISKDEAREWYGDGNQRLDPDRYALDSFLTFRGGKLDFFAENDSECELRADMIEHINYGLQQFAWPPESEANDRRLLALFDRELFRNHIFNVGVLRIHDLVECDRQMLIHRGEQLVKGSRGYWKNLEHLAGTADVYDLDQQSLMRTIGQLFRDSASLKIESVFSWLKDADGKGLRFKIQSDKNWALKSSTSSPLEMLKHFESPERFGSILLWTPSLREGFFAVADKLQVRPGRIVDFAGAQQEWENLKCDLARIDRT